MASEVKWAYNEVDPWRSNLPAGDIWTTNQECCSQKWNITLGLNDATCQGISENKACTRDCEWYPGLFWNIIQTPPNGTWTQIRKIGNNWDKNKRCEFGSLCANNQKIKYISSSILY